MINTTNYYGQAEGLPVENGFQRKVLRFADSATLLREVGKLGSVVGLVSSAASMVFTYDPTLSLTVTAVGGVMWLCFSKLAQKLEPEARVMIEYFRELQQENMEKEPSSVVQLTGELQQLRTNAARLLSAMRIANRKEQAAVGMKELQEIVEKTLSDESNVLRVNQLFNVLFSDNIREIKSSVSKKGVVEIEIQLYEAAKKTVHSESTILYIPKKLKFELENNGRLTFSDEKLAPYEDRTDSLLLKSNFAWWDIFVKGEELELICPHNVGVFTTFAGGTPVVRRVDAQTFLESIR